MNVNILKRLELTLDDIEINSLIRILEHYVDYSEDLNVSISLRLAKDLLGYLKPE